MLISIAKAVLVLIAGPLFAIGLLSAGCSGTDPLLGVACGHNFPISLLGLTLAIWFLLVMGLAVWSALKNNL